MRPAPNRARRLCTVLAASVTVGLSLLGAGTPATGTPTESSGSSDPRLADFYSQIVEWEACTGQRTSAQCGRVTVPLDYANPSGRTISLALRKMPASGTPEASLVVNPGGPGASGLDFAEYLGSVVGADVRRTFDIVGFDTRGVGESAPVQCMTGSQTTRWYRTDITPDTPREQQALFSRAQKISDGCLTSDPVLARFVGTMDTVRDMDIIRSALGDQTLNWFGFSYGTQLGALYAQEFPERVGRMVLDGAVDPSLNAMQVSAAQSTGFQRAMKRFAADCASKSTCIAASTQGVLANINALLRELDSRPMPTSGSRRLVQSEAITALFFAMYSTDLWPALRRGLVEAHRDDGSSLQSLAQLANDQIGPNRYGSNIASAFYAIGCWDYPATPGIPGLKKAAKQWSTQVAVPEMGRAMSWGNAPCSTWFGHSSTPPAAVQSSTSAPILIIGTTYDPATPYAWSRALARQLPTSRLLTHRGDGHTAYGFSSRCIDSIADGYLLTGQLPDEGTVCTS